MKFAFGIIRYFLTGVLIYLSYSETGIYTAISLSLIFIVLELIGVTYNALIKQNNKIIETATSLLNTIKTINRTNTIDKG